MARWPVRKTLLLLMIVAVAIYGVFTYRSIRQKQKRRIAPGSIAVGYQSTEKPDNIVLTVSPDMKTMATITWRTSELVSDGIVQFSREEDSSSGWQESLAKQTVLFTPELVADNTVHCHTAVLKGLSPGTTYRYRVGSREKDVWSETARFMTEPESSSKEFAFAHFGDTQDAPEVFARLLDVVLEKHPEIAFIMMSGDLVESGDIRNFWDDFLAHSGDVFRSKPLIPSMGNHDYGNTNIGSNIFMSYFANPESASEQGIPANYQFRYGNTSFLVINSMKFKAQTSWIEQALQKSKANDDAFTVAMFHFPLYRPREKRNNEVAKRYWEPLFDKYRVDLILTGHDHSYVRSKPLREGKAVAEGESGTVYVTAVACKKFYKTHKLDIAATQFENTPTGQVITLGESNGELFVRYVSYNLEGASVDNFEAHKPIKE